MRGGDQPGAGRPKGLKEGEETLAEARMLPLDYMLKVMRDPEADKSRRDRMAIAAAPYIHARVAEDEKDKGKKAQRQEAAKTAQAGTDWEDDLGSRATAQ